MPTVPAPSTQLYYELHGPESGDPLVLIHGAGAQLVAWHPHFLQLLADAGFRLVLFDNRDVGLSERFTGTRSDYRVTNMSDDVLQLLDHLGIEKAHVAGQSLGGVIAQQLTLDHPDRVASLCIIYSSHSFEYLLSNPAVLAHAARTPPEDREGRIDYYIAGERLSGVDDLDNAYLRSLAETVVDRAWDPEGANRQSAAIHSSVASPERLSEILVPTSILHGREDPIISFESSLAMGRLITGADVHILADMGHQIRPTHWPEFLRAFERNRDRARAAS